MDDYYFWKDAFDTYQSLSVFMQLAWLVIPFAFLFAIITLFLRYRFESRQIKANPVMPFTDTTFLTPNDEPELLELEPVESDYPSTREKRKR